MYSSGSSKKSFMYQRIVSEVAMFSVDIVGSGE